MNTERRSVIGHYLQLSPVSARGFYRRFDRSRREKSRIESNYSVFKSRRVSYPVYRKGSDACRVKIGFPRYSDLSVGDFLNRITSLRSDKIVLFVYIENAVRVFPYYIQLPCVVLRRIPESLSRNFVSRTHIRLGNVVRKYRFSRSVRVSYRKIAASDEIFIVVRGGKSDHRRIRFVAAIRKLSEIFVRRRNFVTVSSVRNRSKVAAEFFKEGFGSRVHSVLRNLFRSVCRNRSRETKSLIIVRKPYARPVNVGKRSRDSLD